MAQDKDTNKDTPDLMSENDMADRDMEDMQRAISDGDIPE